MTTEIIGAPTVDGEGGGNGEQDTGWRNLQSDLESNNAVYARRVGDLVTLSFDPLGDGNDWDLSLSLPAGLWPDTLGAPVVGQLTSGSNTFVRIFPGGAVYFDSGAESGTVAVTYRTADNWPGVLPGESYEA